MCKVCGQSMTRNNNRWELAQLRAEITSLRLKCSRLERNVMYYRDQAILLLTISLILLLTTLAAISLWLMER